MGYRFLTIFAITLGSLVALVIATSYLQLGLKTARSDSICHSFKSRVALGRDLDSPKMLLIGGSAIRAGLSAEEIARRTGLKTFNFGLVAGLGPGLILHQARKVLQPGDTAMLIFEYNLYRFSWTDTALDAAFACAEDYLEAQSFQHMVAAFFSVDSTRVLKALWFELFSSDQGDKNYRWEGSVTRYGDRPLTKDWFPPLSELRRQRMRAYRATDIHVDADSQGVADIRGFVAWARANRVQVLATWPNTIYFPSYSAERRFDEIYAFYDELQVPLIGEPSLGLYPIEMFYDTQYHMNPQGIRTRTKDFIAALCLSPLDLPNCQEIIARRTKHPYAL